MRIYHRSDLRRHHDAADAFLCSASSHLTARCALTCLSPPLFRLRYNGALYIPLLPDTKDSLIASRRAHSVANSPAVGLLKKPSRGFQNEKVLALVVAAAMGLSSVAFAADAASTTEVQQPAILPFTIRNITKRPKPAAEQKAQAAKKHKAAANRLLSKSPGCKETS